jgi:hypothetical protein
MYLIDAELKDYIESGVAVAVGTADASGRPHITWGWGPRLGDGPSVLTVFIETARAAPTLDDLRQTGKIAVTMGHPVTYRSIQFKGRWLRAAEADAEDRAWVQRHREAFATSTALVGDPPEVIRNLWTHEVMRVDFQVEQAFDQTPGPNAGQPL